MNREGSGGNAPNLEQLVGLFQLLSDKTRLNILLILAQGERNVGSLCAELGLSQPTVSHHLGLLRTRNLIANRRSGKQIFYGLNGTIEATGGHVGLRIASDPFIVSINTHAAR